MSKHTVLYWNRATLEVYAVLRKETPPGLRARRRGAPWSSRTGA